MAIQWRHFNAILTYRRPTTFYPIAFISFVLIHNVFFFCFPFVCLSLCFGFFFLPFSLIFLWLRFFFSSILLYFVFFSLLFSFAFLFCHLFGFIFFPFSLLPSVFFFLYCFSLYSLWLYFLCFFCIAIYFLLSFEPCPKIYKVMHFITPLSTDLWILLRFSVEFIDCPCRYASLFASSHLSNVLECSRLFTIILLSSRSP